MEELKYIIIDECPEDLAQDDRIKKWEGFLRACHVDYNESLKDCPEVDFIMPQIDTKVRVKRISDKALGNIELY